MKHSQVSYKKYPQNELITVAFFPPLKAIFTQWVMQAEFDFLKTFLKSIFVFLFHTYFSTLDSAAKTL